jgi:hypothetical protein
MMRATIQNAKNKQNPITNAFIVDTIMELRKEGSYFRFNSVIFQDRYGQLLSMSFPMKYSKG